MSRPVAAIDCGTNTLRLLIRDGSAVLASEERIVRLGQGVDAHRRLHPDAVARTLAAIDEYAALLARHDAVLLRCAATSAARDAENASEFADGVRARLGVRLEILSGDDEARLTFLGAVSAGPVPGPVVVTDIGGGSTEIVRGTPEGRVERARSLDVGAVRLRERFLHDDPPTQTQVNAARAHVDASLDDAGVDGTGIATWIGVAGTFTTLAALALGLDRYDVAAVSGTVVDDPVRGDLLERCLRTPVAGLVGPVVPRARAEVIAGGAVVLAALADRLGRPTLVRDADLLDGLCLGR